jgi:hypothetical protein
VARLLPLVLLAIAPCAIALAAGADPAPSPETLWRRRIVEARELKLWIASAATGLLAIGWILRISGRGAWLERTRAALLVGLCLATLFAWWHPYRGSLRAWLHVGDTFHYYMGAKYFDELGYTRLYHCAAVADAESGLRPLVARSQMRDLETNQIQSARKALRDSDGCKRHFTPERWRSFGEDLDFFRRKLPATHWIKLRSDHGYNPPPTWTLAGGLLTRTGPPGRRQLFALTAIDPLLLLGMFAALVWAFGWQVSCIALIYWGTNQPANWEWGGGSILRFDWLAASVIGLCCLKRGRPATAGALLAWAAAVRIFPIAIAGGVGLGALLHMGRQRRFTLTRDQRRFALAFGSALAVIFALSSLWAGPHSWVEFARNSRLHLASDTVNRMGLRPLLAHRHETRLERTLDEVAADPYARWRAERAATSEARRPLRVAIAIGYLAVLLLALRRQPDWVAGVLAIGAIPVFLELGSYYFGVMTAFACLARRYEEVAVALALLAAATWWVGSWGGSDRDQVVTLMSLATLLFVGAVTLRVAIRPGPRAGASDARSCVP